MKFRKTLMAVGAILFGLTVFVIMNNKKSPAVMPTRTVTLSVAPEAEPAFVEAVRTYGKARQMGFVDQPDTPGAIVILLQTKDEHINVTRYGGVHAPVSASFYRTGGWFGIDKAALNRDANDFVAVVTQTPGVALIN